MNLDTNYKHSEITSVIIRAFYNVYNELGDGFLEKVYENAMRIELKKMGADAKTQVEIQVYYEEEIVEKYYADLLVEEKVIVELKAAENIEDAHVAQLTNYLKATAFEVGLILNFGKKAQFKRKASSNEYKSN